MNNPEPLPPVLYRFRSYGAPGRNGDDKATVHDMLLGRIRFARLRDFNDPFEGRPKAIPAFDDAGEQRAAVLRYILDTARNFGISPSDARRRATALMKGKSQAEIVDWIGAKFWETFESDGLFICCLAGSEAIKGPVSWAHYADQHRGVAIHFDTKQPPVRFAYRVRYSETYPEVVVPRTYQDPWEQVQRALMTKSSHWRYEDEYRAVRVDWPGNERHPEIAQLFVNWDGTTALAGAKAVSGITLGARMPDAERRHLLAFIADKRSDLAVWQADLHRSRYEVITDQIR